MISILRSETKSNVFLLQKKKKQKHMGYGRFIIFYFPEQKSWSVSLSLSIKYIKLSCTRKKIVHLSIF